MYLCTFWEERIHILMGAYIIDSLILFMDVLQCYNYLKIQVNVFEDPEVMQFLPVS